MTSFTVGQQVTATRRLWGTPDDCHPVELLAKPGDKLIVRDVCHAGAWRLHVSHHDRTDGKTFGVADDEITPQAFDAEAAA